MGPSKCLLTGTNHGLSVYNFCMQLAAQYQTVAVLLGTMIGGQYP